MIFLGTSGALMVFSEVFQGFLRFSGRFSKDFWSYLRPKKPLWFILGIYHLTHYR